MTDERAGLPSMSGMERILECPGSLQLAARVAIQLPEKKHTADGTLAHAVLAGEEDDDALEDHEDVALAVERCRTKETALLAEIGFTDAELHVEERIFLHDENGDAIASGKPDRVYLKEGKFLIPDFKTGRKEVTPPAANAQLIGYALLVAEAHGVEEGWLAIIPAWRKTPTVAYLDRETLLGWRGAILAALAEARDPLAQRKAGKWCDYCPARPLCPEAWAFVRRADRLSPGDAVDELQELERYDLAKHAQATIKDYLEHLRARLELTPDAIPGLKIGKGSTTYMLPGSPAAWEKLNEVFSLDALLAAATFKINALASMWAGGKATAKQLTRDGEERKRKLLGLLYGLVVEKPKKGSIERA